MTYQWANCPYAGVMKPGYEARQIPANPAERGPLPQDVFCFHNVDSWRNRIWRLLGDIITDDVRSSFKGNPPEYVVSDDLSWLNEIVSSVTGRDVEVKSLLADRLALNYRAFRAAHGTRTNDLGQFYEQGLRCLRAGEAEAKARELFLTTDFSWVTEERLQSAIDDIDARKASGGREGRLYFCADERDLVTRSGGAGHYLVYGGEYLYCLGMRLVGSVGAKKTLKSVGRPTMFVCDIPMELMRENSLGEFAGSVLEILFCELIDERSHALSLGAGSAMSIIVDLHPDHILGHYHPPRIHDPL